MVIVTDSHFVTRLLLYIYHAGAQNPYFLNCAYSTAVIPILPLWKNSNGLGNLLLEKIAGEWKIIKVNPASPDPYDYSYIDSEHCAWWGNYSSEKCGESSLEDLESLFAQLIQLEHKRFD